MELPFKPQTTPFTCVQATQAIGLNHYLGTNYSDMDVVKAQGGYLLQPPSFNRVQSATLNDVAPSEKYDYAVHFRLNMGILKFLGDNGLLPSLDEAIQGFAEVLPEGHGEKSIAELEERMSSEDMKRFYKEFSSRINNQFLTPLDHNIECDYTNTKPRDIEIFTNVPLLSEGKLTVSKYEDDSFDSYTSEQGILVFGATRDNLNLPAHGSHSWIVDRSEEENFILLDVNHSAYEHGPEVTVPIILLNNMLTNLRQGKFDKVIGNPVLIHHK